jgi:putative sterol carrier protein
MMMAIPFATDEWIKALQAELNNSDAYNKAAATWEGDFYFIVERGADANAYLYLDLWHGKARDAYAVIDPQSLSPAFELSAPVDIWQKVLGKKIDPIRGIMTRQLKLKGNMMKVMKAPKAAIEMVNCATMVPTDWA